jgi:hypothetical protein
VFPDALKRIVFFQTSRYLRDHMTWAALVAFLILLVFGAVDYWNSLPPRSPGSRLFGEGYVFALSLAFHASLAQDRAVRFDSFLVSNFLRPEVLYFGNLLSAVLLLVGFAVIAFLVALLTALGDVAYAMHYTALFFAASLVLLPAVVLVELVMPARYPVPLIVALFFVVLAVLQRSGDMPRVLHWLGFDGQLNALAIAVRSTIAIGLTAAWYPWYRHRLGLTR